LLAVVEGCLDFMYGEAIGLSYILDPNYLSEGMKATHRQAAVATLRTYGSSDNIDERLRQGDVIFDEWATWFEETRILKTGPGSHLHLLTAKILEHRFPVPSP
jgi:hypothetical protein